MVDMSCRSGLTVLMRSIPKRRDGFEHEVELQLNI